ncbi:hypothetical protein KC675_00420 [Candidatus Dojkabacteria bacterium]|uniref:Uncharacterized protein n=1 Tax=Candidatus Dojkabacteria bacterium TaxID=2099670 RepID=A0A955I8B2_9BACT|nr:hypothetical protein [Candidatus Dojkabacteria bacterium]
MQNFLKVILNIIKVFIPGLLLIVLVTLFSMLGVFIEEEPLLMLKGGFDNPYVSISFFVISNILVWLIAYYLFKYLKLFSRRIFYILVPIISTTSIIFFLVLYYVVIFYYLTGLYIFEVDFLFSKSFEKSIATSVLIILNSSIFISLFANFIFILVARKKPIINQNDPKKKVGKEDDDTTNSGGTFEDSISI